MPKAVPKPKRVLATALEESTTPPSELSASQTIAKVSKAEGNHLYTVYLPKTFHIEDTSETHLVELIPALRSTVFLRRNGYVLVDTDRELLGGRDNKIVGTVVGVVLGGKVEREWRSMSYWPMEFEKTASWDYGDDDDAPRMPSDDED